MRDDVPQIVTTQPLPEGVDAPLGELVRRADAAFAQGDFPACERDYRAVLAVLHFSLSTAFAAQWKMADAEASLKLALEHCPHFVSASVRLGEICYTQGKFDEAEREWRQVLAQQPENGKALDYLGHCLMGQGLHGEAGELFTKSLRAEPNWFKPASHRAWLSSYLGGDPHDSVALHRAACALLPRGPEHTWVNDATDHPLRVGYISPNAPCFLNAVLANHDRDKVFTTLYLENVTGEISTKEFRTAADSYVWIHSMSDSQVADLIRRDQIDVLVDLAGHTAGCRLGVFALKPAPIQVTWMGYANTTGLREMDYRITDGVCDPEGGAWFGPEKLVRLPGSFVCYKPHREAPPLVPPPCVANGYVTFGSTNELVKLNGDVLRLWADVLHAVPDSRLLIFRHSLHGTVTEKLRERCKEAAMPLERVTFGCPEAKKELRYLDVYDHIDVLLDPFPWTGHVTTCDALYQGVPVVTLRGAAAAGNLSASALGACGLGHWVAEDRAQYVRLCRGFAQHPGQLHEIRRVLRGRMLSADEDGVRAAPLCDGPAFTRNLEAAYETLWAAWLAGRRPAFTPATIGEVSACI